MGFLLETASTLLALEGALSGVGSHMHLKVALTFLGKSLVADGTTEDFVRDVAVLGPKGAWSKEQSPRNMGRGPRRVTAGAHIP